jgi:ATP-dependent RNA helicase DDX3X
MTPDNRLERTLFGGDDKQTTGINFDNYDKIPVEVSGNGCPDPIDAYTTETIGEDLFRNTRLCGYTKPTPVVSFNFFLFHDETKNIICCLLFIIFIIIFNVKF